MKYAIYYEFYDGTNDSIIVKDSPSKNIYIKTLLNDNEIKHIAFCKIYKSGEYGKRTFVL